MSSDSDKFMVDDMTVICVSHPNPIDIPWGKLDVDIVLECTGQFTNAKKARQHIEAGAKKVKKTATRKGEEVHGGKGGAGGMGVASPARSSDMGARVRAMAAIQRMS